MTKAQKYNAMVEVADAAEELRQKAQASKSLVTEATALTTYNRIMDWLSQHEDFNGSNEPYEQETQKTK